VSACAVTKATPSQLEFWMRMASKAIPLLPLGAIGEVASELAEMGADAMQRRALIAAAGATPPQLEYLDLQNEIDVKDLIRQQGKEI
jgi:hypothetical protein